MQNEQNRHIIQEDETIDIISTNQSISNLILEIEPLTPQPMQSDTRAKPSLSGRVAAWDHRPIYRSLICVLGRGGQPWVSTLTAPDGTYAISGLPSGNYTVCAGAEGYCSRWFNCMVKADAPAQKVDFMLPYAYRANGSAVVSGLVNDKHGKPVWQAWVGLYACLPNGCKYLVGTTKTTQDGFYLFSPVPIGRYTIKVKAAVMYQ